MQKNRKNYWGIYGVLAIVLVVSLGTSIWINTIEVYAEETDYEYDELGRVTKVTYEDGSYVEYEYDSNGNIISTKFVTVEETITDTTSEENGDKENSDVIIDIEAGGDSTGTTEEQDEIIPTTEEDVDNNTALDGETGNSDGHSLNEEYEDAKEEDNVDGTDMEDSTDTADKESPERKNRGEGKIINKSSVLVISVGVAIGIPFIAFIMMLLLKGKKEHETDVKKEGENTDEKKNE